MRSNRRRLVALTVVASLMATPIVQAGFLDKVDKAMKDYAGNIQAEGDANLATMKAIVDALKKGEFKAILPAIDAGMKSYGAAMQKTGDDAWADLKPILQDLINPATYIPGPIKKMWEAIVAKLAVLKARFLRRCENPWADDPPAGGGAGGSEEPAPPAEPPPAEPPPAEPPPAEPPAPPSPAPGGEGGGDVPPAAGGDGSLPAASSTRNRHVVGVEEMKCAFAEYLMAKNAAVEGYNFNQSKVDAKARPAVGAKVEKMAWHCKDMEDRLYAKISRNKTARKTYAAWVNGLDEASRRQVSSLTRRLNMR